EIISTGRAFKNVSRLSEISICTQPANEQATVASLKSLEGLVTIRDVEHWLRDSAGLSKSEAQAVIACVKSAVRSESEGGDDIAALIARISNFQPRI
ncbi:HK97 family phage prohead protease, partial [Metapseudomonas otitidis]